MKFKLVVFGLLLAQVCFAQNEISGVNIGYNLDINGNVILNYVDKDYVPSSPYEKVYYLDSKPLLGYYVRTADNVKKNATFKFGNFPKLFEPNTYTIKKLDPKEYSLLRIGTDSIISRTDFGMRTQYSKGNVKPKSQFAKIEEALNDITFYEILSGSKTEFLAKKNSNNYYTSLNIKKNAWETINFLITAAYGNDSSEQRWAYRRFLAKKGNKISISGLIKMSKYRYAAQNGKRIYFSVDWKENFSFDSSRHHYFAHVKSVKDTTFEIEYYHKNGLLLMREFVSRLGEEKLPILAEYFYPNGKIRKKGSFEKGKLVLVSFYHTNGNLHYQMDPKKPNRPFKEVVSAEGKLVLDDKGNGVENHYDSISNREIVIEFKRWQVENAYYTDENKNRVYLNNKNDLRPYNKDQTQFDKEISYPKEWLKNNESVYYLYRIRFDVNGTPTKGEIIKGANHPLASKILELILASKWRVSPTVSVAVNQEMIIPVVFRISYPAEAQYNYYDFYRMNQFMFYQPPPPTIPTPPVLKVGGF